MDTQVDTMRDIVTIATSPISRSTMGTVMACLDDEMLLKLIQVRQIQQLEFRYKRGSVLWEMDDWVSTGCDGGDAFAALFEDRVARLEMLIDKCDEEIGAATIIRMLRKDSPNRARALSEFLKERENDDDDEDF